MFVLMGQDEFYSKSDSLWMLDQVLCIDFYWLRGQDISWSALQWKVIFIPGE